MHALTADQISLVPRIDLSRRLFAVTSLAAGFASAVTPVSAATITTDAEGLDTGEAKGKRRLSLAITNLPGHSRTRNGCVFCAKAMT